jgi:hypothetical protein
VSFLSGVFLEIHKNRMSKPKSRCAHKVRNLPLERFRLPTDGRKWKSAARSRAFVLTHISDWSNDDGTFIRNGKDYSPSEQTLLRRLDRATLYRRTMDLRLLDLLDWERSNRHNGRTYLITADAPYPDDFLPREKPNREVSHSSIPEVSDSGCEVSHSIPEVSPRTPEVSHSRHKNGAKPNKSITSAKNELPPTKHLLEPKEPTEEEEAYALRAKVSAAAARINEAFHLLHVYTTPYGSEAFQLEWLSTVEDSLSHEGDVLHDREHARHFLPDTIERCIQACKAKRIPIPGPFYQDAKFARHWSGRFHTS